MYSNAYLYFYRTTLCYCSSTAVLFLCSLIDYTEVVFETKAVLGWCYCCNFPVSQNKALPPVNVPPNSENALCRTSPFIRLFSQRRCYQPSATVAKLITLGNVTSTFRKTYADSNCTLYLFISP